MVLYLLLIGIFLIMSIYSNIVMYKKNKKLESYSQELINKYDSQNDSIYQFHRHILHINKKLSSNKLRASFESDDEIGFYFQDIRNLTKKLEEYFADEREEK